jgi:ABC-type transport system involved in multi-copper enzyme maturation permease subunit
MQWDVFSSGLPFLVALAAVSVVFFFSSTNERTGIKILVSLHAVFFAASFLVATALASFLGRSHGLSLAYVSVQAVGIALMLVSIMKFEGPGTCMRCMRLPS